MPPEVTFLGVFDTVAALKRPNLFDQHSKPRTEVVFENETISPLIRKALHLLSLDERRIAFMPTLMNRDPRVTEVWLAGAHSDVGGGYRYDGLSDNALQFMLDFIESDEETRLAWLMPAEIDYTHLFEGSRMLIDYEDLIIQPNPFGKSHEQSALTAIKAQFLHPRSPRVNVNDHPSVYPPTIHRSVFDRMVVDHDYDPEALTHPLKNPYTGERGEILVWEHDGRLTRYENPDVARRDSKVRPRPLRVGERVEITVFANLLFNRTGLRVGGEAGETYRFFVAEGQIWFDARVECGPDGWDRDDDSGTFLKRQFIRPLVGHKRDPDARWLEVVGTIGRNERHCFRVLEHGDDGTPFRPNGRGELFTFANDLRGKYGNNRGSIRVTVQRIS